MYAVVVGAGKVGWNLARELIQKGNELTLVEHRDGSGGWRQQVSPSPGFADGDSQLGGVTAAAVSLAAAGVSPK